MKMTEGIQYGNQHQLYQELDTNTFLFYDNVINTSKNYNLPNKYYKNILSIIFLNFNLIFRVVDTQNTMIKMIDLSSRRSTKLPTRSKYITLYPVTL